MKNWPQVINIYIYLYKYLNNRYYELKEKETKEGIQLKVINDDFLLEILYLSENDSEILDSYSVEKYKLTKTYTIIKIPKNRCTYDFKLSSKNKNKLKLLEFGLNYKISKNNYFYKFLRFTLPYSENIYKFTGLSLFIS